VVTVDGFARGGKAIPLYSKVVEAGAPRTIVIPSLADADLELREGDFIWDDFLSTDDSFDSVAADPQTPINILFSSGTTGDPKAIPWNHLTPIKCAMDGCFHQDIREGDVVAWPTNIGWMMGPWLIFAALMNGASVALYEGLPVGDGFTGFVRNAKVSMLGLVPALVRGWRTSDAVGWNEWSDVRVFSSTGEASNRQDYFWLMSRAGYRAPVIEYCGGTELGGGYIASTVVQSNSPSVFTTPCLGLGMFLIKENGQSAAEGEMGEVFLTPPAIGLSQILLNRDHDAIYHEGCPAGPEGEILRRHGDEITRLAKGCYKAEGRADDTMNLGGIKVSSMELERAMDGHPAAYQTAAVAVPPASGGADRLVVYIVLADEEPPVELQKQLQGVIAKSLNPLFKIHDLVVIETLPRTASNKIMRRKLRDAYREREN
ncbi:MAG: AMP-binding protein, partial [Verrucomicrobiia bacterium]